MKKNLLLLQFMLFTLLTACASGIKQEEYDSAVSRISVLEAREKEANASYDALSESFNSLSSDYKQYVADAESKQNAVNNEFQAYKQSAEAYIESAEVYWENAEAYRQLMQGYESLALAEAEARMIEAEAKIASQKAEESRAIEQSKEAASREAEEESKRQVEEELKGYDTGITYDQLARTPDTYTGKKVKFRGSVVQVLEGDEEIQIRFAINGDYSKIIFCAYKPDIVISRVLEDDYITIYGVSLGLYTYTSTLGAPITIPAIWIDKIDS